MPRSEPQIDESGKRKKRWLRIVGGAILLLSFSSQNFLYDRYDSKRSRLETATEDRTMIDKGALLNEVLYFVIRSGDLNGAENAREFKINQAATKLALSTMISVQTSESTSDEQKHKLVRRLFEQAHAVKDYTGYVGLIQMINRDYAKYSDESQAQYLELEKRRGTFRVIYLGLYVIGSLLLVSSERYE